MRCFACNFDLADGTGYDKPTDRFYCSVCMEPTNQVILAEIEAETDKEELELFGFSLSPLDTRTKDDPIAYVWDVFQEREEENELEEG